MPHTNTVHTGSFQLSFKNTYILYENEIRCTVTENEFNQSQNPTLTTGSNGDLLPFATSSQFNPYVTTVGIYNDVNDLLMVAKLSQPVPLSDMVDTTFVIKYDT
jgi:hypothetical protein